MVTRMRNGCFSSSSLEASGPNFLLLILGLCVLTVLEGALYIPCQLSAFGSLLKDIATGAQGILFASLCCGRIPLRLFYHSFIL